MYQKSAPESIQKMFATIAKNYDLGNSINSLGMHKRWNRRLIESVGEATTLLDLCAGTGEIAFGYLTKHPRSSAILLDFCPEMLAVAEGKGGPFAGRFSLVKADAQFLPLESRSVDAVTISYGIRNVKEPLKCFLEVARVLKPNGRFGILELTRPQAPLLRLLHRLHLNYLLPLFGKLVTRNIEAYRYLTQSVEDFASPDELEKKLAEAGLTPTKRVSLMGGLATVIVAESN